jgi:hypothetical protein
VPKQTFHRRTSNDAKAAKNLHCLINDVEGGFGRVKFGNCSFARNASIAPIIFKAGPERKISLRHVSLMREISAFSSAIADVALSEPWLLKRAPVKR